jgi:hypothetical protein
MEQALDLIIDFTVCDIIMYSGAEVLLILIEAGATASLPCILYSASGKGTGCYYGVINTLCFL